MTKRWMAPLALGLMLAASGAVAQGDRAPAAEGRTAMAVFAGGCFWCVEEAFDAVAGVLETTSGYTGGHVQNPTYQQVVMENTGHQEALRVRYDDSKVTYAELLDVFWRNVDPFDAGGQFCDRGESYRAVIFVAGEAQKRLAEESRAKIADRFKKKIATEIEPAATFYPAEAYHQNYHNVNPLRYKYYKWGCGRAQRLEQIWGPAPKS